MDGLRSGRRGFSADQRWWDVEPRTQRCRLQLHNMVHSSHFAPATTDSSARW